MWNEPITSGSFKYVPSIAEEKIMLTTCRTFLSLCTSPEGREVAVSIINNYINDEQGSRRHLFKRYALPKKSVGKGVSKSRGEADED